MKKRKNGRRKGGTYERKIAALLSDFFKMKFKRTPQSGGWSKETVQGDITPVGDRVFFPISVECKNYDKFPMQVFKWIVQSINDAKETFKIPIVVFHIKQTTNETRIKLSKTNTVVNPFPNGEDFVIIRFKDFLRVVNKKKIKDESKWSYRN